MEIFGVFLVNQSSGLTYQLAPEGKNIIGRGVPGKEEIGKVLLPHPSISKFHAKLELSQESHSWILYDTSKHGLTVNDKKVNGEQVLVHGDIIGVGPFKLMFYEKFKADDETAEYPLFTPYKERGGKSRSFLWFALFALATELLLCWLKPKILVIISASLFFFSFILIVKKGIREKTRISNKLLAFFIFLALLGSFLGYYRIWK